VLVTYPCFSRYFLGCFSGEFSFDSLSCRFSENSSGHGCTQTFIRDHTGRENGPKMTAADLLSSVHVFQRNPVGHSRRTRNIGPAMASSAGGREIFGSF
jgi:hypothetical protein